MLDCNGRDRKTQPAIGTAISSFSEIDNLNGIARPGCAGKGQVMPKTQDTRLNAGAEAPISTTKKSRVEPQGAFVDTEATALRLGVSESYLNKARLAGNGPPFHKFGRSVRYKVSEVDEWAEGRRRVSTSDAGA
jgi:predicted DNA-binding transcriptional regulator AlpA